MEAQKLRRTIGGNNENKYRPFAENDEYVAF